MNRQWQLKRKRKSITNLNQWSGCKWPSRSSGVLPPSDCWPKFSDQNFLTEMCIENSLLSALYIFTFIETIKYISFHLKIPFQRIFSTLSEKHIGNTISFNIIGGLDSAAQFLSRFMPTESWYRPAIETWQKTIRVSSHPVIGNLSHPTCFQVFWKKYLAETLKMTPPHRSILI